MQTNIFIDCHVFDESLQGTSTYITGLYQELIKDKSKRFFFATYQANLEEFFGIHENVVYLKFSSNNKFYRLLIDIPRLIKQNKIDYAHFQYIVPPIKNCKYIITVHDLLFLDYPEYFPFLYRFSKKILFKFSAKKSDIVLTVSEYSKKQVQRQFKIDTIGITPNAVNPVFFESFDKNLIQQQIKLKFNVENYFLFVSRWEPRKNHQLLLKVFVENEYYKKYSLVFIGAKAIENKEYNDYYNSLSIEVKSKIFNFHKLDFDNLLKFVRGSSLSIYPSKAEGFGIPPLESLACNVPTVCSNTTAMSDFSFFEDCLFNPESADDLKQKIKIALNDYNISDKREAMQKKYSWELSANNFKTFVFCDVN